MDASFPNGGSWPPNLIELYLGVLKKPMSEWGPQNFPTSLVTLTLSGGDVSSFSEDLLPSSLTRLGLYEFEELESISKGLQCLTSLQHLIIHQCPKMMHLPETLLPSLLSLHISESPKLEERCRRRGRGSYWPLISHIPCIKINFESI